MTTVVLSREGKDFASFYGFVPKVCKPRRKETKGKVERPYSYIRSSFFVGTEFSDLADLNEKAMNWLDTVANVRVHGTTQAIPFDRLKRRT
jgi:transposase